MKAAKPAPKTGGDRLVFREVTPARWKDLVRLFEQRGGPSYCWCMAWRSVPPDARSDRKRLKAALARRVQERLPIGILGYDRGEPIAWCSIAPRSTYRSGLTDEPVEAGSDESVWSLVCFFVARSYRRTGTMKRLLGAAVDHARRRGATVVEAYPVDPDSPSYRFMGFVPAFTAAGFREIGRAGSRRHVMLRRLQPASIERGNRRRVARGTK